MPDMPPRPSNSPETSNSSLEWHKRGHPKGSKNRSSLSIIATSPKPPCPRGRPRGSGPRQQAWAQQERDGEITQKRGVGRPRKVPHSIELGSNVRFIRIIYFFAQLMDF